MTPATREEMLKELAKAQEAGRLRSFYEVGSQIVVVPLAGQTKKVATPKALSSYLATLGASGRSNIRFNR